MKRYIKAAYEMYDLAGKSVDDAKLIWKQYLDRCGLYKYIQTYFRNKRVNIYTYALLDDATHYDLQVDVAIETAITYYHCSFYLSVETDDDGNVIDICSKPGKRSDPDKYYVTKYSKWYNHAQPTHPVTNLDEYFDTASMSDEIEDVMSKRTQKINQDAAESRSRKHRIRHPHAK